MRASVFGPMRGTSRSRPSAAAARSSSAVRIPRARPISTARSAPMPSSRPNAASSSETFCPLELAQLGDVPGVDELAQPRLDAGTDAAQVAHAAGAHELLDRCRRRPDQLGGAAVRAGAVVTGAGELEQCGVLVEARGDRRVVHGYAAGSSMRNVAPLPSEPARTRPPWARATAATIESPSPTPPLARERDASAR